ncbi:MAG: sigma-70 family RNA polymerase sigma factor [Sedimentisphaerales bacterium]|nr:sigma-70 family RNA polymerase sigma factor [Sedimentisphaerales bacterium]
MKRRDYTEMGGAGGVFLTTHWSLIDEVQKRPDEDRALIGLLLERYWKPVYCYLRRKGYDNEQAKDLTQGFFHEIVLNLNLFGRADPSKGRFRTLLLYALNQYLLNEKRRETAQKTIPKDKLVSLDAIEPPVVPRRIIGSSPEDSYNYAWVSALLDQVLLKVKRTCREQGLETHWSIFSERVVEPMLNSTAPPSLAEICEKYSIESEKKASNMIVTIKRRFHAALKQYIRSTVTSEGEMSDELKEIMQFLPKSAQHSR